jgi:DNA-binding response OmpR family regulator
MKPLGRDWVARRRAKETSVRMATILVVDDERPIVEAIDYNLRKEGYSTLRAFDAEECMSQARGQKPDLVVLDIMLPSGSGYDLCRQLRAEHGQVPVLFLTARAAEEDRITGFDAGADDYVVKPFSMRELLARIRALLRRTEATNEPSASADAQSVRKSGILSIEDLSIDNNRREVRVGSVKAELSRKEFDLLWMLASNRGQVFDRQTILNRIWGEDCYVDERTVDVHIRWLREKIEKVPAKPQRLVTIRGIGYKFSPPTS